MTCSLTLGGVGRPESEISAIDFMEYPLEAMVGGINYVYVSVLILHLL